MVNNKEKIIKTLFEKPEYHFHIRELARATKLHPNTVIKITDELAKEEIIIKKQYKSLVEVFCRLDSNNYKRKKQLFNIAAIQESGLIDKLIDFYNHPQAIVLFGSFFRGEDWSDGDVDLAVVNSSEKVPPLSEYEKKLKRKIHLLAFEYKDISEEFYNNLINGLVLYGFIKDERLSRIGRRRKS